MEHLNMINGSDLIRGVCEGGCGECQVSCQSAVKTSSAVANQRCENKSLESENK